MILRVRTGRFGVGNGAATGSAVGDFNEASEAASVVSFIENIRRASIAIAANPTT